MPPQPAGAARPRGVTAQRGSIHPVAQPLAAAQGPHRDASSASPGPSACPGAQADRCLQVRCAAVEGAGAADASERLRGVHLPRPHGPPDVLLRRARHGGVFHLGRNSFHLQAQRSYDGVRLPDLPHSQNSLGQVRRGREGLRPPGHPQGPPLRLLRCVSGPSRISGTAPPLPSEAVCFQGPHEVDRPEIGPMEIGSSGVQRRHGVQRRLGQPASDGRTASSDSRRDRDSPLADRPHFEFFVGAGLRRRSESSVDSGASSEAQWPSEASLGSSASAGSANLVGAQPLAAELELTPAAGPPDQRTRAADDVAGASESSEHLADSGTPGQ